MKTITTHLDGSQTIAGEDDPPIPLVLSKTAFNKHGWSRVGMARHQAILESAKTRAGTQDLDYKIRAAYQQYVSAETFDKLEVADLGALLVLGGLMDQETELNKYLDQWPEA